MDRYRFWDIDKKEMYYSDDFYYEPIFSADDTEDMKRLIRFKHRVKSLSSFFKKCHTSICCNRDSSSEKIILMRHSGITTTTHWEDLTKEQREGLTEETYQGLELYENDIVEFYPHIKGAMGLYLINYSWLNHWWYAEQMRRDGDPYTGGFKGQHLRSCKLIGNWWQNPEIVDEVVNAKR